MRQVIARGSPKSSTRRTNLSTSSKQPILVLLALILLVIMMALVSGQSSSKSSPRPLFRSWALTSLLRASTSLAARSTMKGHMTSSFNPQIADFQPAVTQTNDLPSSQPFVAHNNDLYSHQPTVCHDSHIYSNQSTVPQSNNSHSNSYPGFGLYTAEVHYANHLSNAHGQGHGHGPGNSHVHAHATERQQTSYFAYPSNDVEAFIVSHGSLSSNNYNRNAAFASFAPPTTNIVPFCPFANQEYFTSSTVSDGHRPGRLCPDNHPYCHGEYARFCHNDPATCRSARDYLLPLAHPILTDLLL
jgi:hypothetical protein